MAPATSERSSRRARGRAASSSTAGTERRPCPSPSSCCGNGTRGASPPQLDGPSAGHEQPRRIGVLPEKEAKELSFFRRVPGCEAGEASPERVRTEVAIPRKPEVVHDDDGRTDTVEGGCEGAMGVVLLKPHVGVEPKAPVAEEPPVHVVAHCDAVTRKHLRCDAR